MCLEATLMTWYPAILTEANGIISGLALWIICYVMLVVRCWKVERQIVYDVSAVQKFILETTVTCNTNT